VGLSLAPVVRTYGAERAWLSALATAVSR